MRTRKNVSIEFIRIIACLLVIMAHIQFPVGENGGLIMGRLVCTTAIGDCVPLFFLITGFFFFDGVDADFDAGVYRAYIKKIKKFIGNVYVPALFYILFSCLLRSIQENGFTLYAIEEAKWSRFGDFIFSLSPGDLLWYVCIYLTFVLFYPLLAYICQNKESINRIRRIILAVLSVGAIIVDVQYFCQLPIADYGNYRLGYGYIYLLLGYELKLYISSNRDKKRLIVYGLILYVVCLLGKVLEQFALFKLQGDAFYDNRFQGLDTFLCLGTSVGLFLVLYYLGSLLQKKEGLSNCLVWLGGKTFYIYLFHTTVLDLVGVWRYVVLLNTGEARSFATSVAYYVLCSVSIFIVTLLVAIVFDAFYNKLFRKIPIIKKLFE